MDILDAQAVGDAFPQDGAGGSIAQLGPIFDSAGGYYNVTGAAVYAQYAYGKYGEFYWTDPVPIPVGPAILAAGTVGVRFKNYTPGSPATVSGALSEHGEPAVQITAGGVASVTSGAGSMQLIGDVLLAAAAANIDFSGISQSGFTHLKLIASLRSDAAVNASLAGVQVNADGAAADYESANLSNANVSFAPTQQYEGTGTQAFLEAFLIAGAASTATVFGEGEMTLFDYANTTKFKSMTSLTSVLGAGTAASSFLRMYGGVWRSLAGINRLTIVPSLGATNFVAGSRATLYGLKSQ